MGYEAKLARSFSRVEPQKLGLGLLAVCFLVSLAYISVTNSFADHFPICEYSLFCFTLFFFLFL